MGVSFTHPAGSIAFKRGPARPERSMDLMQPRRQSAAGQPYGFAHTVVNDVMKLQLRAATVEKDLFVTWFRTVAKGMAEQVTYIDPFGNSFFGSFDQANYSVLERACGVWEISIPFRVFGRGWTWPSGDVMLWPSGDIMGV